LSPSEGRTDILIRAGVVAGNINQAKIRVTVGWGKVNVTYSVGNTLIDTTTCEDMIHFYGIITSHQQQKSICLIKPWLSDHGVILLLEMSQNNI
jgi:hypothetical protein